LFWKCLKPSQVSFCPLRTALDSMLPGKAWTWELSSSWNRWIVEPGAQGLDRDKANRGNWPLSLHDVSARVLSLSLVATTLSKVVHVSRGHGCFQQIHWLWELKDMVSFMSRSVWGGIRTAWTRS
jgi:hypothetical protein